MARELRSASSLSDEDKKQKMRKFADYTGEETTKVKPTRNAKNKSAEEITKRYEVSHVLYLETLHYIGII